MPPEIYMNDVYQTLAMSAHDQTRYDIRPMLGTDIEQIIEIEQLTWNNDSWSFKNFNKALNTAFWSCWVLESTASDHSMIGYGLQYALNNASHIANLTLRPNQCGRGLGGILLRHMINHARQNGAVNITLEVNTSNTRAYTLYVNHGFRKVGFLPCYYSEYSDAYRMTLSL